MQKNQRIKTLVNFKINIKFYLFAFIFQIYMNFNFSKIILIFLTLQFLYK